jgi:hypothetical protein
MPYPNEHSCRLIEPSEAEVVGSGGGEHEGKPYRIIYGKPRGGDGGSVEQAYRYSVEAWGESEARNHCELHGGTFEQASRGFSGSGIELRFWASVQSIEAGDGARLATFYLMDTDLNRNRWRVTDEALEGALASLLGKPLGCVPGYGVNHAFEPLRVGRWVRVEKPDGYALATAEITDDVAWERVEGGGWGPVSVVIRAFRVTCSACGGDITGAPDIHVVRGEGHEVVESFAFDRVDFVSEPAYPQAGLMTLNHPQWMAPLDRVMFQASRSKPDGAQGPQGSDPKPEGKREKEKMETKLAELRQELETLERENRHLRERLRQSEDERHGGLVERALDARFRAGLARDLKAESERLKGLDDETLGFLAEDAERVAERLAKARPLGPKTKHASNAMGAFEVTIEDMRERLFGHRREAVAG